MTIALPMMLRSVERLLDPVSESKPTGDNLEYQPEFAELERAAQGKPARQMGSAVAPGEPPNFARVAELAAHLLQRSKDLRIAVQRALCSRPRDLRASPRACGSRADCSIGTGTLSIRSSTRTIRTQ